MDSKQSSKLASLLHSTATLTMPPLPIEIVVEIFKSFDNIDDCLRLGRCCRRLYAILDGERLSIMRSIILRSSVHEYDVRLCHFKDVYWTWASRYLQDPDNSGTSIPLKCHPLPSSFEACLSANELNDQQVWDVVARWHGLAPLRDMYLHPSIHQTYSESPVSYIHLYRNSPKRLYDTLRDKQDLDVLEELSKCSHVSGAGDSDKISTGHYRDPSIYKRFYKAMTWYWLTAEAMRFAKICRYSSETEKAETWNSIDTLWYDATLQDIFHTLEVYDFVYGYLATQIQCTQTRPFASWVNEGLGYVWPDETRETNWAFSLHNLRLVLTPSDIIELLILTSQWKQGSGPQLEWESAKKHTYLAMRLFYSTPFLGQVEIRDIGLLPDLSYTVQRLEWKFERTLLMHLGATEGSVHKMWTDYRKNKWRTDARGKAVSWGISDKVIVDRIKSLSG